VYVGNQRGAWDACDLAGERGTQSENVVHDDMWLQFPHERERVAGGIDDGLVEVEWLFADWEDAVLGSWGECESLCLHMRAPTLPGLQRNLVAAGG
jgi:hypothetical protein